MKIATQPSWLVDFRPHFRARQGAVFPPPTAGSPP